MLRDNPPDPFCPAMNVQTIADYIKFKRNEAFSPFIRIGETDQAIDVFGIDLTSYGGWNDPKNVDQLLSAVGAIHSARGHRGQYEDY